MGYSADGNPRNLKRAMALGVLAILVAGTGLWAQGDYQKGLSYFKQKQYSKAIAEFEAIVKDQPDYESGHRILGLAYLNTKQYDKAIQSFREALRLKDDVFTSYSGLALAYFNTKRYKEVIPTLNRGERYASSPADRYRVHRTRGAAAFNTGEYQTAAADLEKATQIQRANYSDLAQLGIAYYHLRNFDKAEQYLKQAVAVRPEGEAKRFLGLLKFQRGVDLIDKKQYRQAAQVLSEYVKESPEDGGGWFNLGLAYLFSNNLSAAQEAFLRGSRLTPSNAEVFERLGFVYEKRQLYRQALEAYEKSYSLSGSAEAKASLDRVKERLKRARSG